MASHAVLRSDVGVVEVGVEHDLGGRGGEGGVLILSQTNQNKIEANQNETPQTENNRTARNRTEPPQTENKCHRSDY